MAKKLALIVPYRDRAEHLARFIPHMKKFLKMPYRLFIIEQASGKPFNRGKLLNIGFSIAKEHYDYVCFHDVDMLPVNADYSYPESPTHLATHVEQFDYDMPYDHYFGGVTLFNLHDFSLINGYNNQYFGWGVEDDDLRLRCMLHGLRILSRPGIFLSLDHPRAEEDSLDTQANRSLFKSFVDGDARLLADGLISLQYTLLETEDSTDFFRAKVSV